MRFFEELKILREVMRTKGSMQTWRDQCLREKHKNPDKGADEIAIAAKEAFIFRLERHEHETPSISTTRGFAFAAIRQVTEATAYRGHDATKTAKKIRQARGKKKARDWNKGRTTHTPTQAKKRHKKLTGIDVKVRPPLPRSENKEANAIKSVGAFSKKKGKIIAAAKQETPKWARFIDEGIGGSREQALEEQKKLSSSMLKRSRDQEE